MSGGGREGGGERDGKWGEGCRQVGGENRHSQRANEQNHTENGRGKTKQRTNRKRTGNLLIKANRTGDSVLVRIYISPTQTRDGAGSLWPPPLVRCHGMRLRSPPATAPPDSPPRRRPLYGTGSGSCSLPRLYATGINRIDGSPAVGQHPGAGPDVGPSAGSEPTGGARCIPLGAVCAAGGGVQRRAAAAAHSRPLLPPGSVDEEPSAPQPAPGWRHAGDRETKPGGGRASRMPCCPPRLAPHAL